jgi:hypothetical protein
MAKRSIRFISALVLTAMVALPSSAADKQDSSIASEYKRLNKEFEAARQDYFKAYSNAKTDEERKALKYPDTRAHARQLLALAEKDAKDPAAVEPLVEAFMHGRYDKEVGPNVLELLKTHHLESEKLARACQIMTFGPSREEARKFLELALEKNPHREVKAAASLSLGQLLASDDARQAEKHFNSVIEKYGTKEQKETAKGQLFEIHNLGIGKVAPEIEGKDIDGKSFKLSDYRGKVVVLDFWGDW